MHLQDQKSVVDCCCQEMKRRRIGFTLIKDVKSKISDRTLCFAILNGILMRKGYKEINSLPKEDFL